MHKDKNSFIKQIKNKNPKGLDFIVNNYSNLVFKITHSVLNSSFHSHHIEECVNDVFLSVWNNIDSFDENKGNFKKWISAISKYKAIDYKRKFFKQSTCECIDKYELSLYDKENLENNIISKENRKELLSAINEMHDKDREIFIRRYFLYEGIENIAKTFGVNRSMIDKRLSRGRKLLKEKLILLKEEML